MSAPGELQAIKPISPVDLRDKFNTNIFSTSPQNKNAPDAPVLHQVFLGQPGSGQFTPNDNCLAVNNNGIIVSCINSSMFIYDSNGVNLKKRSFSSLIPAAGLPAGGFFYDPRIIYLPKVDRFVIAVLYGQDPATSRLMICISNGADPGGIWNFYAIAGGLGNNDLWMDYPQMGQNNGEIFITGNLFHGNGNFGEAVILQVDITSLQSGNINYKTWTSIDGSPFSICPASASNNTELDHTMHFIYNEGSEGSYIYFMQIKGSINDGPSLSRNAVAVTAYRKPLPAFQKGSQDILDQGDCRIRQAYYKDGLIHGVYTTSGSAGNGQIIYMISDPEKLLYLTNTLSDPQADIAFPAVAPASSMQNNKKSLVFFLASGKNNYPECRMVTVDDLLQFSEPTVVKAGEGYVDIGAGTTERWGDYTGLVKTYETQRVSLWAAGSFGNAANKSGTILAQVLDQADSVAPFADQLRFEIFPNPANGMVFIQTGIPYSTQAELVIYRSDGSEMGTVWNNTFLKSHSETIALNLQGWASGLYIICLKSDGSILSSKKLMLFQTK